MSKDAKNKPRAARRRHFWTPVWLFALVLSGFGGYALGQRLAQEAADEKDIATLAVAAMNSPDEAVRIAESKLLSQKLPFSVYRDVIRGAFRTEKLETTDTAFESMARVMAAGGANKRDLENEIQQMKPIVVLVAPEDGEHNSGLDEEVRVFGATPVVVARKDRAKVSAIICYRDDTCSGVAGRLRDLLIKRGYELDTPATVKRMDAAYDKRIDVLLAPIPKAQTNTAPASPNPELTPIKTNNKQRKRV